MSPHQCPTCGTEMTVDRMENEGICVTPEDHAREARRLANADPVVADPKEWDKVYEQNLLHSIAHSLVVIAETQLEGLT